MSLAIWVRHGFNGMSVAFSDYRRGLDDASIQELAGGSWAETEGIPDESGPEARLFRIERSEAKIEFLYLLPVARPGLGELSRLLFMALDRINEQGVVSVAFNGIKPDMRTSVLEIASAMVESAQAWLRENPKGPLKHIWFVDLGGRFEDVKISTQGNSLS
jgi:hypothetical protein